jgi:hypothetical protein
MTRSKTCGRSPGLARPHAECVRGHGFARPISVPPLLARRLELRRRMARLGRPPTRVLPHLMGTTSCGPGLAPPDGAYPGPAERRGPWAGLSRPGQPRRQPGCQGRPVTLAAPCSGAGPNGATRTARASGALWPDHSPTRRPARPRGVTPQGIPGWTRTNRRRRVPRLPPPRILRLALAPGCDSDGATRTRHQGRRTRFTATTGC